MELNVNNLLKWLNTHNQMEVNEVYKALIAYSLGLPDVTEKEEIALQNTIDYYFENDNITGFVNQDLVDFADLEIHNIE